MTCFATLKLSLAILSTALDAKTQMAMPVQDTSKSQFKILAYISTFLLFCTVSRGRCGTRACAVETQFIQEITLLFMSTSGCLKSCEYSL